MGIKKFIFTLIQEEKIGVSKNSARNLRRSTDSTFKSLENLENITQCREVKEGLKKCWHNWNPGYNQAENKGRG